MLRYGNTNETKYGLPRLQSSVRFYPLIYLFRNISDLALYPLLKLWFVIRYSVADQILTNTHPFTV